MTNQQLLESAYSDMKASLAIMDNSQEFTATTVCEAKKLAISAASRLTILEDRLRGYPEPKRG